MSDRARPIAQKSIMKKRCLFWGIAASVFLSGLAAVASAGTLTLDPGPSFLPNSSFTDNTITDGLRHDPHGMMGDVVRLYRYAMVSPAEESPRILIGGDFSANPGDLFTVVYDFVVNLNSPEPITLTLGGQTTVAGVAETFNTLITLDPGRHRYQGQVNGPAFSLATSGTWKGHLYFNFSTPSSVDRHGVDPGNLIVRLRRVDYRLTAVPEPSSYALLGVGAAALTLLLRRRRIA